MLSQDLSGVLRLAVCGLGGSWGLVCSPSSHLWLGGPSAAARMPEADSSFTWLERGQRRTVRLLCHPCGRLEPPHSMVASRCLASRDVPGFPQSEHYKRQEAKLPNSDSLSTEMGTVELGPCGQSQNLLRVTGRRHRSHLSVAGMSQTLRPSFVRPTGTLPVCLTFPLPERAYLFPRSLCTGWASTWNLPFPPFVAASLQLIT